MDNRPSLSGKRNYRGLEIETKTSPSGRGRTFFLTSLFIELIENWPGLGSMRVMAIFRQLAILGEIGPNILRIAATRSRTAWLTSFELN
jgi:hypothetical protein